MAVLAFDLATAFAARQDGGALHSPRLPVQYADYAPWQARVLGAAGDHRPAILGRQLAYWADRLDGVPEVTADLPMDRAAACGDGPASQFGASRTGARGRGRGSHGWHLVTA